MGARKQPFEGRCDSKSAAGVGVQQNDRKRAWVAYGSYGNVCDEHLEPGVGLEVEGKFRRSSHAFALGGASQPRRVSVKGRGKCCLCPSPGTVPGTVLCPQKSGRIVSTIFVPSRRRCFVFQHFATRVPKNRDAFRHAKRCHKIRQFLDPQAAQKGLRWYIIFVAVSSANLLAMGWASL